MNESLPRVVHDDPNRMRTILDEVYAQSADILAAQAPNGLIPKENITISTPAWRGVHARTAGGQDRTTIRISLGLVHLIYRVNRALALRARIVDHLSAGAESAGAGERSTLAEPSGDAVEELARVIDRAAAPMMPLRDAPPLQPQQVAVAELYTHWAEKFLLNHELAHAHGIDRLSADTIPLFAQFRSGMRGHGLEHASDLFGAWLATQQSTRQLEAWGRLHGPVDQDSVQRFTKTVYAGAEIALHAVSLLELYDEAARTPTHPWGHERIQFLRHAYATSGQGAVLDEAREWTRLLARDAPAAIARAQVNASVAIRNLEYYLETGTLPGPPGGTEIDDPIADLIWLSRAGSMSLLLRSLREPRTETVRSRAKDVAERYLPQREEAFRPFWRALETGEGNWT